MRIFFEFLPPPFRTLLKGLTPMPPPPGFWHWCFGSGARCLHSEDWGLRFGLRGLGSELAVWGLRSQARNLRLATATGNDNGNGRVQRRRLPRTMAVAREHNGGGAREQWWRRARTMATARENTGGGAGAKLTRQAQIRHTPRAKRPPTPHCNLFGTF